MSYSINGLKIDNFKFQNLNKEIKRIKKITKVEGDKKVCELFNIFLIHYLNYKTNNNESYIKDFFHVFTERNDVLEFKINANNLYEGMKDFFKNHLFDEKAYFYFSKNKEYCLVSIKKENFVSTLVDHVQNYKQYSLSTATGYTSYNENTNLTESQSYNMVKNDWDLFTKNSIYIYKHAVSIKIFSYLESFNENSSDLINQRTLKEALLSISDDIIYYYHKEFFVEEHQRETTDYKSFLKQRREILNSENIRSSVLNDFRNKIEKLDPITLTDLFESNFDFK